MAEQEITRIKLSFESNVKQSDVESISSLSNALERLGKIDPDNKITSKLKNISDSMKGFKGINIGANVGKGINTLVETLNQISDVKDISPYAEKLSRGFSALSEATKHFEGNSAKIPVGLGRGITGIIEATNKISTINDISSKAQIIKNNFKTISEATQNFDGMKSADYSGIARLVTAMTGFDKIKPIDKTVLGNAKTLAQAIKILDTNVDVSIPKMNAMASVAKSVGSGFKQSSSGANQFGNSLKLINFAVVVSSLRTIGREIKNLVWNTYGLVDAFGDVQNTLSFFGQSLGSEAAATAKIIQQYADYGVVDFTQMADQVSKLNQMYRGYGIASEDAAKMALNMTQLAYDASYALGENGKDLEKFFNITNSIAAGQTRAAYNIGVDISVSSLSENFDGLTNSADKATKVMAAYEQVLANTAPIQGQLTREVGNAYVQMQVFNNRLTQLKQSLGMQLVPMFQVLIKWGLVALKVIERVISAVARLFGGSFELINYEEMINGMGVSMDGVAESTKDTAENMADATKQAKEYKKTISGIDQVFTINDNKEKDSGSGKLPGGSSGIGAGGVSGYDWLDGLASAENIKMLDDIDKAADLVMKTIKDGLPYIVAVGAAFGAWKLSNKLMNGLKWITSLKGVAGSLGFDKLLFGTGFLLLLDDLTKFKEYFEDFMANGATFDNVTGMLSTFVGMLGDIFIMLGNTQLGGSLKVVQGITEVVTAIYNMTQVGVNWDDALKVVNGLSNIAVGLGILKGNWALVGTGLIMKGALGIIEQIGSIVDAIKTGDWSEVDKFKLFTNILMLVGGLAIAIGVFKKTVETANTAGELTKAAEVTQTVSTATGGVSTKLVDLAKNIAVGVGILVLVAAGAIIFVASIWAIGELLQKVGEAWRPVIDDGGNIALAIGLGTALLATVGLAAWALGTVTISSGGSIPLAIAAGTAMLVLLSEATKLFVRELASVANVMSNELHPELQTLNDVMPDLSSNMGTFTDFMIEFAGHTVRYTVANAISGLSGTIDTIIGWFTKDPIKKMADDANKNGKQFKSLKEALEVTNPLAKKASDLMGDYRVLLETLKSNADKASSVGTMPQVSSDFKLFSSDLKAGFSDLQSIKTSNVANIMSALSSIDLNKFKGIGKSIVTSLELGITGYTFNFTSTVNKIKTGLTFTATSIGSNIARDVINGINNYSVNINSFSSRIKSGLTFNGTSIGNTIASSVVRAINGNSVNVSQFTNRVRSSLSFNGSDIGYNIAQGVINGINNKYVNISPFTNDLKNAMKRAFDVRSPSRWARDVIGENIALGVGVGVNDTEVSFNPFKRNISKSLYDIIDGIEVTPTINMPTFDTRSLNGDISNVTKNLDANVSGQFDYTNDGTEKAVNGLTGATINLLERLIVAVEDGKNIYVDGDEIGKLGSESMKNEFVRLNTSVLGR